ITGSSHATESPEGSAPTGIVHAPSDAAADGAQLLGPTLLGLSPGTVDALVAADPDLAVDVSNGLRSGDPYTVDATLTTVSERVGSLEAGSGLSTPQHGFVIDGAVLHVVNINFYMPWRLQTDILASTGIEREQAVAQLARGLNAG